jgi:hypothetical protein
MALMRYGLLPIYLRQSVTLLISTANTSGLLATMCTPIVLQNLPILFCADWLKLGRNNPEHYSKPQMIEKKKSPWAASNESR